MEKLIDVSGYANTYEELCNKIAVAGEYYNVLNPKPFTTYRKVDDVEIGDTLKTTDVMGWYKVKAELESYEHPKEGHVFITGLSAPYTRWKAEYVNYVLTWVEDGKEDLKIVKKYTNVSMLTKAKNEPEEGIFYAVGKEAPYKVYGVVSTWEPIGTYISYVTDDVKNLIYKGQKSYPGEIAFVNGLYYLFKGSVRDGKNNEGWVLIDMPEPMENVNKHVWLDRNGDPFKLREGQYFGTLEYYQPKE